MLLVFNVVDVFSVSFNMDFVETASICALVIKRLIRQKHYWVLAVNKQPTSRWPIFELFVGLKDHLKKYCNYF